MPLDPVIVVCVGEDLPLRRDELPTDAGVELIRIAPEDAALAVKEARIRGGVVAVADAGEVRETLLTLGADEVIGLDETTGPSLGAAIRRARTRASLRLDIASDVAINEPLRDGDGLAFLTGAMVHHITDQLAGTLGRCDRIEALSRVCAEDTITERAVSIGKGDSLLRPGVVDSDAIRELVVEVARALRATTEATQRLLALTLPAELGMCDLGNVALEVASLVERQLHHLAELTVKVPDPACIVPVGRETAMQVISSLLRSAMGNVQRVQGHRGRIAIRLNMEEELVVLEITDDGAAIDPEVRRQALESPTAATRIGAHGLSLIIAARQIRRAGGEILIDSQSDLGTTVRVFFPASTTTMAMRSSLDSAAES